MTATIDFLIEHKENVLLVPNLALKIQPTNEMMESLRKNMPKERRLRPDSSATGQFARPDSPKLSTATNEKVQQPVTNSVPEDIGRIWFLDADGNLQLDMIRTGISDGKYTEIVESRRLAEGTQIVTSVTSSGESTNSSSNSTRQSGPGFGGPPPF
jgi:hypothetical protein